MAKAPVKKKTTTRATAAKPAKKTAAKPVVKKAPARKSTTTVRRSTAKKSEMKSLALARDDSEFFSLRLSKQSFIWLIFALAVFAFGLYAFTAFLDADKAVNDTEQSASQSTN